MFEIKYLLFLYYYHHINYYVIVNRHQYVYKT